MTTMVQERPLDSAGRKVRIYQSSLTPGYDQCIERGFQFLGNSVAISSSTRIAIKPNLTFPVFRRGVMTNPEAIEALVRYLSSFTKHITICESDSGGYNRFSIDEVFHRTGIVKMANRYGIRTINMSYVAARKIQVKSGLRTLKIPLPNLLLDETDLFITMPVPKVHANTGVSLGLKNQWGVIQDPAIRLKLHPYFTDVIYRINKALPQTIVLLDGKFGLDQNGPMRGNDVELNWFVLGNDIYYMDYHVSKLMGFDFRRISYLRSIFRQEKIPGSEVVDLLSEGELSPFRFQLNREWTDYPGLLTFRSRLLAFVGYESFLAKPLHKLLYCFREPFY